MEGYEKGDRPGLGHNPKQEERQCCFEPEAFTNQGFLTDNSDQ